MDKNNIIEMLISIALASFGGIVKRLSDMEKNPKRKVTLTYYIIGSTISMFVGIVVFFICKSFEVPQFLTAGITALAGYMGTPVLDLISEKIKKYTDRF